MDYSDLVMEHFINPRNVGIIEDADGVGREGNPVCGDLMEIYIKVDNGNIADVKFRTFGCGAAIATSSIATEMVKGKPLSEAESLSNQAIVEALGGLPAIKVHCSVLAVDALKRAIEDYHARHLERQGQGVEREA
ncbi:MAG: Fe-S cluster assembly scaffold protein NifU [Chloroflexota bacterium]